MQHTLLLDLATGAVHFLVVGSYWGRMTFPQQTAADLVYQDHIPKKVSVRLFCPPQNVIAVFKPDLTGLNSAAL